jgi:hypothetical protein
VQDAELTLAWAGSRLGSGMSIFHPLLVEPFRLWPKHFLRQPVGCLCNATTNEEVNGLL